MPQLITARLPLLPLDRMLPRSLTLAAARQQVIIDSTHNNVETIHVDYKAWTLRKLCAEINRVAAGRLFTTIGLFDHGGPGEFCLLESVAGGSIDMGDFMRVRDWESGDTRRSCACLIASCVRRGVRDPCADRSLWLAHRKGRRRRT